jgi:predicted dienelactone hydrolase
MSRTARIFSLLTCAVVALGTLAFAATPDAPSNAVALYRSQPGPWTVTYHDEDWFDSVRKRPVPVRIYIPTRPGEIQQRPVVIFSHGWGGSRKGYGYFAQHLASWGYLVIAPTHVGSDTDSIALRTPQLPLAETGPKRETLMQSIQDPSNLRNRPRDISFVIDQLSRIPELSRIADLNRIGVAGHSFGAYTAMAVGGMRVDLPDGRGQSFRDPRVRAVLPMSPEGSGLMGIRPNAWDAFAAPVLFLTGTHDYGPGLRAASWREEPFRAVHTVRSWLVTLIGANHLTFVMPRPSQGSLVESLSVAFFDAQLRQDAEAQRWMTEFFSIRHSDCIADHKG